MQQRADEQRLRHLATSDVDQLVAFHANKNRHYTQFQSGSLSAELVQSSLGDCHLFRETLNLGALIQAAPDPSYLPFGCVLPGSGSYRFCGTQSEQNCLIQATGGSWDLSFSQGMAFIGCIFQREYFSLQYQELYQQTLPEALLSSRIPQPYTSGTSYALNLNNTLNWLQQNLHIHQYPQAVKLLNGQLLQLTLEVLNKNLSNKIEKLPKRVNAAKQVIDYLQSHCHELPDMAKLCSIGKVSERSLQYGFIDYLGITPIQYLRLLRLNFARNSLLNCRGTQAKVADIAMQWGFIELGRFSRDYKKLFAESPSQTLRSQRDLA